MGTEENELNTEEADVEGHVRRQHTVTDDGADDVEGHRSRKQVTDDGADDVEGHVQPRMGIDHDR